MSSFPSESPLQKSFYGNGEIAVIGAKDRFNFHGAATAMGRHLMLMI